jgi:hypothetical protein
MKIKNYKSFQIFDLVESVVSKEICMMNMMYAELFKSLELITKFTDVDLSQFIDENDEILLFDAYDYITQVQEGEKKSYLERFENSAKGKQIIKEVDKFLDIRYSQIMLERKENDNFEYFLRNTITDVVNKIDDVLGNADMEKLTTLMKSDLPDLLTKVNTLKNE